MIQMNSQSLNDLTITRFQKRISDQKIKCTTCRHGCILSDNSFGKCKTRINSKYNIRSLNYGNISSMSVNPIEKKPFYHFYPGTFATTVGSWSCNFTCPWCQNYTITKTFPTKKGIKEILSPEELYQSILKKPRSSGISFSFNEPTLLVDYAIDVLNILKKNNSNLYSNFVTNGYMSLDVLEELTTAKLSAMVVGIKGGKENMKKYCDANINHIFENISIALERKIHIEIVVLVITEISDSIDFFRFITKKIVEDCHEDVPIHFNAYYPAYNYHKPRTSLAILEKARSIAMEEGLRFVYIGNILGHPALNTYCPSCKEKVITRNQSRFVSNILTKNHCCPSCSEKIPIID